MLLVIDVGNTQIYVGVFDGDTIKARFRRTSSAQVSADELGVFIKQALRENDVNPEQIKSIAISSVVPVITRSIVHCAHKYFDIEPFVISAGIKTSICFDGPGFGELGADRVADIEGALYSYPGKDLLIVDFGTANTFCAISKTGEYLGGAISAGVGMSMAALASGTALLSNVEIKKPECCAGLNTTTQLQAGLFYTALGSIKEICSRLAKECFKGDYLTIGTGGLARMFENEGVFDHYEPDLVLIGLKVLEAKNK